MQKIPTLFVRDEQDRRYVTEQVSPGCEWVLAGEGVSTRKYDGTCVMLDDGGQWWARREVKPGKSAPEGFRPVMTDEVTGKTVGWEPAGQSSFAKYIDAAVINLGAAGEDYPKTGTYELIGPKVNGNPERRDAHELIRHDDAEQVVIPRGSFAAIRDAIRDLHRLYGAEGVVWHHPDGRMAKLKVRDFPR